MKKLKHVFIILFFVTILLSLGGAYCYFFTDIFKEPMDQFLEYAKTIEVIDVFNEEFTNELLAKMKSNSSEITLKASADLPTPDNGNTDYSKFNLELLAKNDVFLNKGYAEINFNYADNNLFNIHGLVDINNVAINSSEIVEQYVGASKENIGKVLEKATNGDIKESEYNEIVEILTKSEISTLTEEQSESMKNTFFDIVKSYLNTEKFVREKDVSTMYKEQSITVDSYSVTFTKEDVYNILIREVDSLKNDSTFLNFIVTNYNTSKPETELSVTSLTELLNSTVLKLQNTKATETDLSSKALILSLYVSENKVIKIDASYDSNIEFSTELYTDGVKVTVIGNKVAEEALMNGESVVEASADRVGFSINVTKSNPSEIAENYIYDISLIENNKIMYKLIIESIRTGIVSTNNIENSLNITFKNMPENEETKVHVDVKTEFKENVEIADIDPTKTVFLDKVSDEEFTNILNIIKDSIFKVYSNKVKTFEIITAQSSSTIIEQPGMEVEEAPAPAPENKPEENQNNQQEQSNQQEQPEESEPQVSTQNLTRDQVKEKVVNAIIAKSQEIVNSSGRNITLQDLQGLKIDGEEVSALITNESATLTYKGFSFTVDSSFNIS